jgi:hypothetical protein
MREQFWAMTPDQMEKIMRDENDTTTADLPLTPATELSPDTGPDTWITVAGWGTGTVAELEHHLAQITNERDAFQKEAQSPTTSAALELYNAVALAAQTSAAHEFGMIEKLDDELNGLKHELAAIRREIDDADIDDIEARIRDSVEEAVSEADAVIDADAIWLEIEERAGECAAEAARQVVRDELVVNVDLI